MIYSQYDVVIVPFPFTDKLSTKHRPALILSEKKQFNQPSEKYVLSMITSSKHLAWPLDVSIGDLNSSGLNASSIIRMKIFTLDNSLIVRKIGRLSNHDRSQINLSLKKLFAI